MIPFNNHDFQNELVFSASRSGGPGGQNVNKVSSKVELRFSVLNSNFLDEREKQIIQEKLKSRINNDGELIMVSQSERSQLKNKEKVTERFYLLINRVLTPKKPRRPTTPSLVSKEKRLESKRIQSLIKESRKRL